MHILVTGATGFVGRHLVPLLVDAGHDVHTVCRDCSTATRNLPPQVVVHVHDLEAVGSLDSSMFHDVDVMIHLAWQGLTNFKDPAHLQRYLPSHRAFLETAIRQGIPRLLVTGTCLEHGMAEGCLSADRETVPVYEYAIAKDRLRRDLEHLSEESGFILQWVRLFYMYGRGQNPRSLLPQLDAAIDRGDPEFHMSRGAHARDYLPVEAVAAGIKRIAEHAEFRGRLQVCSGRPTRIRDLVEAHIKRRGASIRLLYGSLPDPTAEPFAFWGVPVPGPPEACADQLPPGGAG